MRKLFPILFLLLALCLVAVGCQNPPWANRTGFSPQPFSSGANSYNSGFSAPSGSSHRGGAPMMQGSGSR